MKIEEAERKSARMLAKARREAGKIVESSKRLGGWLQGVIDGMTGKNKEVERKIKEEIGKKKNEFEKEENKLKNTLSLQITMKRKLEKENELLKDMNSDLSKQNEHLRSQIPQESHEYHQKQTRGLER